MATCGPALLGAEGEVPVTRPQGAPPATTSLLTLLPIQWDSVNGNFERSADAINFLWSLIHGLQGSMNELRKHVGGPSMDELCELFATRQSVQAVEQLATDGIDGLTSRADDTDKRVTLELGILSQSLAAMESKVAISQQRVDQLDQRQTRDHTVLLTAIERIKDDVGNCASRQAITERDVSVLNQEVAAMKLMMKQFSTFEERIQKLERERLESQKSLSCLRDVTDATRNAVETHRRSLSDHEVRIAGLEQQLAVSIAKLEELPKLIAALEQREARDNDAVHARIDALTAEIQRSLANLASLLNERKRPASAPGPPSDEPLLRKSGCLSCDFTAAIHAQDRRPAQNIVKAPISGMAPGAVLRLRHAAGAPAGATPALSPSATRAAAVNDRPHVFLSASGKGVVSGASESHPYDGGRASSDLRPFS